MAKISINMKEGSIKKEPIIVGIDLGTTNSLIAYIKNGDAVAIKNISGDHTLTPSIVNFNENGSVQVGDKAKEKLISEPENTIYSVKRLLGKSFQDLKNIDFGLSYRVIENDDEDALVKILIHGKSYSPIELSAEILKDLKQKAETELSQEIEKAVITVPAYFNDSQRQATRDAGKLAGLDVLRIVNEPTAASLAYGIGQSKDQSKTIAVYDLGGGTFDVSILQIEDGIFDVLATHGDTFLGGDDVDRAIVDYWIGQHPRLEGNKFLAELRLLAEAAKKQLSSEVIYQNNYEEIELKLTLEVFNTLIKPIAQKTVDSCLKAMVDAELTVDQIDEVVMVGGSTRIPLIKEMVSDFFKRPVHDDLNPDEVVALGAAIQADILAGNRTDMLLLDVTPLSLGIETVGGLMDTLLPRNSKVPSKVGRQYTTSIDGQKNLKVSVYQGERDLVEHNRKLGEFILKGIPPMPAGIPKIEIQFLIDADGILKVKAKELRSNVETEVKIKSAYGISEEEMGQMLAESLINAEADMKIRSLLEATNEANNVLHSVDKFLLQNKEILTKNEVEKTLSIAKALRDAVDSKDKDLINSSLSDLNDYTTPLAHRALDHNIGESLKGKGI